VVEAEVLSTHVSVGIGRLCGLCRWDEAAACGASAAAHHVLHQLFTRGDAGAQSETRGDTAHDSGAAAGHVAARIAGRAAIAAGGYAGRKATGVVGISHGRRAPPQHEPEHHRRADEEEEEAEAR